jgi:predicted RNA-binding Zn-ribbon protein involved in translation (DUF1610 family)
MSELFIKARQARLPEFALGKVAFSSNGDKATSNECPVCGPNVIFNMFTREQKWRFKCENCKKTGDTIDYISFLSGLSARDAALKIVEIQPDIFVVPEEKIDRDAQMLALSEVSKRLFFLGHTSVKEVITWASQYGLKESSLIGLALDGRLKMLPNTMEDAVKRLAEWIGPDLLTQAGLWKAGKKCPAIAFRQIMMFSADRKAIEFSSIDEATPSILYGELSSPIVVNLNEFNSEVLLVNSGKDGLKAIGGGFHGSVWNAPNGNWRGTWFWEYIQKRPNVIFNLTKLPDTSAAEVAAMLQSRNIAFH